MINNIWPENCYYAIEGYTNEIHIELYTFIDKMIFDIDTKNHVAGVAEIGVMYGRNYCLLNAFTDNSSQSYAIDIFDNQKINIDRSGDIRVTLEKFKQNLLEYDLHKGKNTRILNWDSINNSTRIKNIIMNQPVKFFSVDGGHTSIHTLNDLRISEECINEGGIVILDDFHSNLFPGPTEGLYDYLRNKGKLVPLILCGNTLILCNLTYRKMYFDYCLEHFKNNFKENRKINKKQNIYFTHIFEYNVCVWLV